MKKKTIDKRKMYRECWALDNSFYRWLLPRIIEYKKDASKIVNLEYHKFEYKGQEYTQLEMIDMLIDDLKYVTDDNYFCWTDSFNRAQRVLDVWALIGLSMWW